MKLGHAAVYAAQCFAENFIGVDYGIREDLTGRLPDARPDFNATFIPIFQAEHPNASRIAAGLACGSLWTVARGLQVGDIVLSPDSAGVFHVGEVSGGYFYRPDGDLPHRRPVVWRRHTIEQGVMTEELRNTVNIPIAVCDISNYVAEIEKLISVQPRVPVDEGVENSTAFALEKHLEDFLVDNWSQTGLGHDYHIFEQDGELVGQQYITDTGPLDILAVSNDEKELLVVELKKGRASDAVVGQILRYMGYVQNVLARPDQTVRGVIIALEDDQRIRQALTLVPQVTFYRYEISFRLVPA